MQITRAFHQHGKFEEDNDLDKKYFNISNRRVNLYWNNYTYLLSDVAHGKSPNKLRSVMQNDLMSQYWQDKRTDNEADRRTSSPDRLIRFFWFYVSCNKCKDWRTDKQSGLKRSVSNLKQYLIFPGKNLIYVDY